MSSFFLNSAVQGWPKASPPEKALVAPGGWPSASRARGVKKKIDMPRGRENGMCSLSQLLDPDKVSGA